MGKKSDVSNSGKRGYKKAARSSTANEGSAAYTSRNKSSTKLPVSLSYDMMDDGSLMNLMKVTRAGIKYSQFQKFTQNLPFTMEEWADMLHLSGRSMLRYKKEKKTFDPIQAEKILQIVMLYQRGVEVFGEASYFDEWLGSRVVTLGGVKPKSLLDNNFGITLVRDQLGRIEHGVLA